jgi:hypothetical protein
MKTGSHQQFKDSMGLQTLVNRTHLQLTLQQTLSPTSSTPKHQKSNSMTSNKKQLLLIVVTA